MYIWFRSRWPRGLSRRSASARLLRSWVRNPPGAWMFVCCECCVLSGRGLCDEPITLPEESYRLWCVVVCDLETSRMWRPWPVLGRSATKKNRCCKAEAVYGARWNRNTNFLPWTAAVQKLRHTASPLPMTIQYCFHSHVLHANPTDL